MEHITICINRLRGSNAIQVGRSIAEALDFKYLDRSIITHTATELGFDEEYVKNQSEKSRSAWENVCFSGHYQAMTIPYDPVNDIFQTQTKFIKDIQSKYNTVIVGHLANKLFEEENKVVSIFLNADLEDRIARIMEIENMDYETAKKHILKVDKDRDKYYKLYALNERCDLREYDLCINVSTLGVEGTVEVILDYIKRKFPELR